MNETDPSGVRGALIEDMRDHGGAVTTGPLVIPLLIMAQGPMIPALLASLEGAALCGTAPRSGASTSEKET
jgi:hypothetical protein